jgi:hypothetical protein
LLDCLIVTRIVCVIVTMRGSFQRVTFDGISNWSSRTLVTDALLSRETFPLNAVVTVEIIMLKRRFFPRTDQSVEKIEVFAL